MMHASVLLIQFQLQREKFDSDLKYIKKWLPEFETAKYPQPMIEHRIARERALASYKNCLKNSD